MIGVDWETLLSSAAFVPRVVPDAIFGATGRADVEEVKDRFGAALADIERVAGWRPTPAGRIDLSDGRLYRIETTIRDCARCAPLDTTVEVGPWGEVVVPTLREILRIKGWLVISRNAKHDFRDAVVLAERLESAAARALSTLDDLYPQSNGASAVQQLARQLAAPRPFDQLGEGVAADRLFTETPWTDWSFVVSRCRTLAVDLMLSL